MTKYFAALLMFFVAWPSFAADLNGYTAQYECRAGGSNCNVDITTYTSATCAQTITTADSASTINTKLNTGGSPICITNGDYTSKGTLNLTASGTSGAYRVLRYYRSGDNNDDPWNQTSGNQAKLDSLDVSGNYWIIHRLTFPANINTAADHKVRLTGSNYILNRCLVDGVLASLSNHPDGIRAEGPYGTVQNNVMRNGDPEVGAESIGFKAYGDDLHVVNNEFYDWSVHIIQIGNNNAPTIPGVVFENNDVYTTSAHYTGDGRAKEKSAFSAKARGTSGSPQKIIHNRIWGTREFDSSTAGIAAGGSSAILINGPQPGSVSYILVQNNIIFDNQQGIDVINGDNTNISVIGNMFYLHKIYYPGFPYSYPIDLESSSNTEVYLNTLIDSEGYSYSGLNNSALDIRCNVNISSGGVEGGISQSNSIADYNVFYDSSLITANGTSTNINKSIATRANSTAYSLNTILRTAVIGSCVNGTESACFLYKVTVSGKTAGSAPAYCTSLGCTTTDGSMTVQAVRGPYSFYRKLRTAPEQVVVPYARAHASAPEANSCPSNYMTRSGIGINDGI